MLQSISATDQAQVIFFGAKSLDTEIIVGRIPK